MAQQNAAFFEPVIANSPRKILKYQKSS